MTTNAQVLARSSARGIPASRGVAWVLLALGLLLELAGGLAPIVRESWWEGFFYVSKGEGEWAFVWRQMVMAGWGLLGSGATIEVAHVLAARRRD